MSRGGLDRLSELFDQALEQEPEGRQAWLEAACGEDPGLLAELTRLLDSHQEAFGYFADLADNVSRSSSRELAAAADRGLEIGAYRTIVELGRGGMGVVYLGERSDGQFERRVAVKLIRREIESQEAVRRFLAERQILARLDHPNIARLLDGGVTEDGRPYLVMEYVDGVPLDRFCDERHLGIEARLTLFMTVGEAVQYAHRNLVIHRDLKPSNILVTDDGSVKLVDFGIAKLLDEEDGLGGQPTATSHRALTPDYAAPEQVLGGPVTTATDVYALGVVLYELMSGQRPYAMRGKSAGEMERLIEGTSPPLPSSVVTRVLGGARSTGGEETEVGEAVLLASPTNVARNRGTRPERLRRRLAGDLDRIALKALNKEPERRYPSAEQLVADIECHLRGLPVVARGDSLAYRARKFVGRHALGVAMAAGVVLLIAGFAVAMAFQSLRLARQRDRAEQTSALLVDLFQLADPGEARGETVTAREILDRGTERIENRLSDQPEVKAGLLDLMGQVYQNLGLYDRALPLLEQALELRRTHLDESHGETGDSLDHLGELLRLRGDYEAAEELLGEALEVHRRAEGEEGPGVARTLNHLGKVHYARGDYARAEPLFRRALAVNERLPGAELEAAESLNNLAALLYGQGRFAEAEARFREALELRRRHLGSDHPSVAAILNNLASLLARQGDHDAAGALHEEALALYRKLLGDSHPRVATNLNNLALVRYAQGDNAGAEPLLRQSLAIRRQLLDPAHPDIAQSLSNLGLLLQSNGELEEAEASFREALEIRRRAFGDEHPSVVAILNNLAMALQARGAYERAEPLLLEGLSSLRRLLGDEHPQVATNLNNLASLLHARGDLEGAEPLYRQALEIRRRALPAAHPHVAYALVGLGRLLLDRGEAGAAEPLLREAVATRVEALPSSDWQVAEARAALGGCMLELGRLDRAEGLLIEAQQALRDHRGAGEQVAAEVERRLEQLRQRRQVAQVGEVP